MAFTNSLYYPWINVQDEAWLKTAFLYWDTIQTIVPESVKDPYGSGAARDFCQAGSLVPLFVNPDLVETLDGLTEDALTYLESSEGTHVLLDNEISQGDEIYFDKLPRELVRRLEEDIHFDKLSSPIGTYLGRGGRAGAHDRVSVDARFAGYYMTLLATKLAEQRHLGLLSDRRSIEQLSRAVRLDSKLHLFIDRDYIIRPRAFHRGFRRFDSKRLVQGMVAGLAIEKIEVDPSTPAKKLIEFKKRHRDELAKFRTEVDALTTTLNEEVPLDALRQSIADIYTNQVEPAISDLKKSLSGSRIVWETRGLMAVTFYSTSGTSVILNSMGLDLPRALFIGASLSIVGIGVLYNQARERLLRMNPYSYLFEIQKKLA